jgi:lysine 2,3-aminomutase
MKPEEYYNRYFAPAPHRHLSKATEAEWNSWIWQQQNRLRSLADLSDWFSLSKGEREAFGPSTEHFRVAVTPYYAALMDPNDPDCPIRRQGIPSPEELIRHPEESADPLAEEAQSPVPGLVHRYPDRVLLYTNHNCPVYCRHCTRKRKVGDPASAPHRDDLSAAMAYIRAQKSVREVILSGGDPLSLSDARLKEILEQLYAIPHLEVVRIGTRNPVTLPQRITETLAELLGSFPGLVVMTHFNHPRECTRESLQACLLLANAGIPIFNQMVLMRGINDDVEIIDLLNRRMLMMKVRPYYIFHCDAAEGVSHFRTTIGKGLELMAELEGKTSGVGVPAYVVDLPGGGGKVRLSGQFAHAEGNGENGELQVRDFNGARKRLNID